MRLLEAVLQAAGEQWSIIDNQRLIARFGPQVLGYDTDDVTEASLFSVVHRDDQQLVAHYLQSTRDHQALPTEAIHLRLRDSEGNWQWCDLTAYDKRSDPAIGGLIVRMRLSPLVVGSHALSELPVDDDSLASLAEVVPAAILVADTRGRVVYTNKELRRLLHRPVRDLSGTGWRDVVHPDDVDGVARTSLAALGGQRTDMLLRITDHDDLRWVFGRFAPRRADGEIVGLVAVFDDVTAQREVESQLAHQATHDPLTGVPNRVLLRDRLAQALGRQSRSGDPVTALFIDLDGFKEVNDLQGHRIGDVVLVEVARRMLAVIRPTDTVARLGGDEFIVISDGLDLDAATRLAHRLGEAIADPITVPMGQVTITAAIGGVTTTARSTVDDTIHQADAAMYRAKRRGPGSVDVHELT